jgi:pimeloyl-ACP methyl ester carboxylesterase
MPNNVTVSDETLLVQLNNDFVSLNVRVHTPDAFRRTVICVHSFIGNGRDFDTLASFLATNGYRVVCPDMLGRGGSAHFGDPKRYDINTYLHTLANVAKKFGETKISLLGVEWGGVMALLFARRYRKAIDHLIIAQVPLDWSTDKDPSIQLAMKSSAVFESSEAALAHTGSRDLSESN